MTTFLLGDCLDLMKGMSDKSVDCFICDLPYGCLHPERTPDPTNWYFSSGQSRGCSWDVKIDLVEFWKQVKRLCKDKHTPVLMFCNTKFGAELINSNPSWFRYDLVWDKKRGVSFLSANKQPMKSHEMIYVFSKAGAYYKRIDISGNFGPSVGGGKGSICYGFKHSGKELPPPASEGRRCPLSVITVGTFAKGGKHPTQKPEELYRWLLTRYCPAGGTVLDPTAGSFNACFVAKELGLKAIGMEKDRGFFYKAVARLLKLRSGDVIEHI
jgi:site-specific DNA-methyltransferase (adenine-specific)